MNKIKLSILSFGILLASAAMAQEQNVKMNDSKGEPELTPSQIALSKKSMEKRRQSVANLSVDKNLKRMAIQELQLEQKEQNKVQNPPVR